MALFYDLKFLVPVVCTFEILLSVILIPRVFRDADKSSLGYILFGAVFGSIAGILLLNSLENNTLKIILGVVIIVVALNLLREKVYESKRISNKWGVLAGFVGGVLGGMFGTSGPAYVTFLAYQTREKHVFRATLILVFAIEYSWRMVVFLQQGLYGLEELKFTLWLAPALIIATLLGHKAHFKVNDRVFQSAISGLLLISGVLCFL